MSVPVSYLTLTPGSQGGPGPHSTPTHPSLTSFTGPPNREPLSTTHVRGDRLGSGKHVITVVHPSRTYPPRRPLTGPRPDPRDWLHPLDVSDCLTVQRLRSLLRLDLLKTVRLRSSANVCLPGRPSFLLSSLVKTSVSTVRPPAKLSRGTGRGWGGWGPGAGDSQTSSCVVGSHVCHLRLGGLSGRDA